MKIAILADIHGNYISLNRCISYAAEKGIDTFLFLGDYIGELAYPEVTMKRLYDIKSRYNCTFIKGNKEDYWIDYRAAGNADWGWADHNSTTGMLLYAYSHLTNNDIDFFEKLPIIQKIEVGGYDPFIICHGSPYKATEKMIPGSSRIHEIMDEMQTGLIIGAHTHQQGRETYNGKTFLNPGSVGMPYLSEGKAQFLILHSKENSWAEEFISLEYDIERVISDMRSEKLDIHAPYWNYSTERLLRDGKISNGSVLSKVMALCEADMGQCSWPHIPEKYWEQAIQEIYR